MTNDLIMNSQTLIEIAKWAFTTLIGGVIGFYLNEYLKKRHEVKLRNRNRESLESISEEFKDIEDVFKIESGDPFFDLDDILVSSSGKRLIIEIPEKYSAQLKEFDSDWDFRKQESLNGSESFDDLVKTTKIDNLKELIEKHTRIIAEDFLSIQKRRTLFNGGTKGIYRIGRQRRGESEKSKFQIVTYDSDFFTQRVFASIYQELRKGGHRISKIEKLEEFTNPDFNYTPFIGGIAATTFVVLHNGHSIILAERSEYTTSEQRKWHYTMDEGFTQTDIEDNKPSLKRCFYRGLEEELNIFSSKPPKFMDVIFHRNVFELEFTSLFPWAGSYKDFKANYNLAKDRDLETYKVIELELSNSSIRKFIKMNEDNIMPGCKLSLQLLAQRDLDGILNIFK